MCSLLYPPRTLFGLHSLVIFFKLPVTSYEKRDIVLSAHLLAVYQVGWMTQCAPYYVRPARCLGYVSLVIFFKLPVTSYQLREKRYCVIRTPLNWLLFTVYWLLLSPIHNSITKR